DDIHTFAMSKPSLQALFGLIKGVSVVQPGMLYHRTGDGRWAVSDVMPGGAAAKANVQRGDVLVSVDGTPIEHGFMDFAYLLCGPEGTKAKLWVERRGDRTAVDLELVSVSSPIVESRVLAGGIGYVRIWACTQSDDATHDAGALLAQTLVDLDKKRVKRL